MDGSTSNIWANIVPHLLINVLNRLTNSMNRLYTNKHKLVEYISNNGSLVRAITGILFYTDLIGTMIEIN